MNLTITFDIAEFDVYASLKGRAASKEQVNFNNKALSALDYKSAEFCYDTQAFDKKPTDRQVISFLRRLLNDTGIKLNKELLNNITITPSDAEYLVLALQTPNVPNED